jgi:hypothetical protein
MIRFVKRVSYVSAHKISMWNLIEIICTSNRFIKSYFKRYHLPYQHKNNVGINKPKKWCARHKDYPKLHSEESVTIQIKGDTVLRNRNATF